MSAFAIVSRIFAPATEVVTDQDYIHKNANCTIRLYYYNQMVHQQHVCLRISRCDDVIYYGVGQSIRMEGFTGKTVTGASIALIGVPFECDISWGTERIIQGNALTLQAHKTNGLLTLSTDKMEEYENNLPARRT